MKAYLMVVASAAAALASCGSDGPENLAANVQAGDTNAQASDANAQNGLAEPADANTEAPVESGMPVPGSNVREMEAYPDRNRPAPAPPPEPTDEPEVDPHAGHDMNNMAH